MQQNMNENNKESIFAGLRRSGNDFGSYQESLCEYCTEGSTSISKKNFEEYKKWWENEAASIYRNISGIIVDIGVFHFSLSICFLIPRGLFKYYIIKELGGLGQKMAIFDDLQ